MMRKKIHMKYYALAVFACVGCQSVAPNVSVGLKGQKLPPCPGTYEEKVWTDCAGTLTSSKGDKYTGEFKDGKYHGKGKTGGKFNFE